MHITITDVFWKPCHKCLEYVTPDVDFSRTNYMSHRKRYAPNRWHFDTGILMV